MFHAEGGDVVGEVRAEHRHPVPTRTIGPPWIGTLGKRSAVLEADEPRGLRDQAVRRGADRTDEADLLGDREEQADVLLSLAGPDAVECAEGGGRGGQVVARVGLERSGRSTTGDAGRGEGPATDVSDLEVGMSPIEANRDGLERARLVGASEFDDASPHRGVVPVEELDAGILEVGVVDPAPELGVDRVAIGDPDDHERRMIEVGGDEQRLGTATPPSPGSFG